MIVVGVVGLLASIALPNFAKSRRATQVRSCITNLRRLDDAKAEWALEKHQTDTSIPATSDITPYLRGNQLPPCPTSGTYRLRRVSRTPVCSLSAIGHTLTNVEEDALPD